MKNKIIIGITAIVLTTGAIVFATNVLSTKACCPITEDCQPGDPNCVCTPDCVK